MDPIGKFKKWYAQELASTKLKLPAACCLSTIGVDGFPNSRFVSLKEVINDAFIITGTISSKKGEEIKSSSKVSLTFWWPTTLRQVRIQGNARFISESMAKSYFKERNRASQIVSSISNQGEVIDDYKSLKRLFRDEEKKVKGESIDKPENWSGFSIEPIKLEFMTFKSSRLHKRELFVKNKGEWSVLTLQP